MAKQRHLSGLTCRDFCRFRNLGTSNTSAARRLSAQHANIVAGDCGGRYMMEPEEAEKIGAGQSALYLSVACAYRDAYFKGASESDCRREAVKAVRSTHPFLLETEASRLASRIVSQFFELYPEWLSA
jgi:hypothetical protein